METTCFVGGVLLVLGKQLHTRSGTSFFEIAEIRLLLVEVGETRVREEANS